MDNTIKFNFLKFSDGNLENENGKKNLLASDDLAGKAEEDSKFILEGDKTIEKKSIVEEVNINNVKLDKKHIIKSDNENELAIGLISVKTENPELFKVISPKKINPYITKACNTPADFLFPLATFLWSITSLNTRKILFGRSLTVKSDFPLRTIFNLNRRWYKKKDTPDKRKTAKAICSNKENCNIE